MYFETKVPQRLNSLKILPCFQFHLTKRVRNCEAYLKNPDKIEAKAIDFCQNKLLNMQVEGSELYDYMFNVYRGEIIGGNVFRIVFQSYYPDDSKYMAIAATKNEIEQIKI